MPVLRIIRQSARKTDRLTEEVCLLTVPFYRDIRRHSPRASARDRAAPFCVPAGAFRGGG